MSDIIRNNNCKKHNRGHDADFEFKNWSDINWKKIESRINRLRSRIFLAKLRGSKAKKIRCLQRFMIRSKSNLLYAIRRVTSVNRGKKTPGTDKQIYLTPERRLSLFREMCTTDFLEWNPSLVRRTEIPRPGKDPRSLGIPTIKDRIVQAIVKNALEPEWEAIFEHGSYGFRPARSSHDAMSRLWRITSSKKRLWVLDADIKGCFNNMAHNPLLEKLDGFPARDLIQRWLRAGYFKDNIFYTTDIGTPQGGIISPLLANIALHGMENILNVKYHAHGYVRSECPFVLVRYADDFVVLCRTETEANQARQILAKWLAERGMEFSPEKTNSRNLHEGFDFLGWCFRLYRTEEGKPWLRAKGKSTALVIPSKKSITAFKAKIKESWRKYIGNAAWVSIKAINPIIKGWASYHKYANSNKTFRALDHFMYQQAVRFMRRSHPNKSWGWLTNRYFSEKIGKRTRKTGKISAASSKWTFQDGNYVLQQLRWTSLENYASIHYGKNPFNPIDKDYFIERKTRSLIKKDSFLEFLLQRQRGICPICGGEIVASNWDEPLHVHHLIAKKNGGTDALDNLMLLHEECHYNAHSKELGKEELLRSLNNYSEK